MKKHPKISFHRISLLPALATAAFLLTSANQANSEPLKWSVGGEARARYESLDGQFRSNKTGSDQGLFFRTLVQLKAETDAWTAGVEVQDSRSYLTDSGSAISSSYVNPVDFLQAYIQLPVDNFFQTDYDGDLTIGRQTISIGSKRQIERVSFANVIKNYTGVRLKLKNSQSDEWHFFAVVPVKQYPDNFDDLLDNQLKLDEEEFNRLLWGAHYRKSDAFPSILANTWGELFAYGLHERDAFGNESPNRQYITPGFRIYRRAERTQWDLDLEGALRFGKRRATSAPTDTRDLDVFASMLLFRLGYTFDHPMEPNLAFQYYWASGDDNPNDGKFDQYERLFGGRRTDLNNTSLHGPLTPANLSAPSVRFEMKPTDRSTFRLTYSAAFLASNTDAFVIGKQRDSSGQSGSFIGHVWDSRVTYEFIKDGLELEVGASAFFHGEFTKSNPQAPDSNESYFTYMQLTYPF